MVESHGSLDKTMYGESSVCHSRQPWVFFVVVEFFTVLSMYTLSFSLIFTASYNII